MFLISWHSDEFKKLAPLILEDVLVLWLVRSISIFRFHWNHSASILIPPSWFLHILYFFFLHLRFDRPFWPFAISQMLLLTVVGALSFAPVLCTLTFKYQFANKLYLPWLHFCFCCCCYWPGTRVLIYRPFNVLWHNGFLRLAKKEKLNI